MYSHLDEDEEVEDSKIDSSFFIKLLELPFGHWSFIVITIEVD